jgi:hypothetical protein
MRKSLLSLGAAAATGATALVTDHGKSLELRRRRHRRRSEDRG